MSCYRFRPFRKQNYTLQDQNCRSSSIFKAWCWKDALEKCPNIEHLWVIGSVMWSGILPLSAASCLHHLGRVFMNSHSCDLFFCFRISYLLRPCERNGSVKGYISNYHVKGKDLSSIVTKSVFFRMMPSWLTDLSIEGS